ncbi:hypothetical protein ACM66B_003190 [Microbotryomycetes sp. NB124-2]
MASKLIRLAKDVYLARPSPIVNAAAGSPSNSTGGPRLVVLLGWMDAQLKHLDKYVQGYSNLYPQATVLVVQTHQTAFYSSSHKLKTNLKPVVEHIRQEFPLVKAGPESPVLVHTFSNGGCFGLSAINQLLLDDDQGSRTGQDTQERQGLLQGGDEEDDIVTRGMPARAFVFDSCPGSSSLKIMIRAFTAPIRNMWLKVPASGLVAIAFLVGKLVCFIKRQPDVLTRTAQYLNQSLPPRPRLYLYSQTDLLIPARDVERHAADAKMRGVRDVDMHNFGKSMHVSHARTDPEAYWNSIKALWDRAGRS